MRSRRWIVLVAILVLSMAVTGCGLLQGVQEVTDVVKEVSEQIETPKETSADPVDVDADVDEEPVADEGVASDPDDSILEDLEIVDVDSLDSYRQLLIWAFTEGEETEEWAVTTEYVRNPPAQRTHWRGTDWRGDISGWEMIQIGPVTYMRVSEEGEEEEWMSMTSEDAEDPEQQLDLYGLGSGEHYLRSGYCEQGPDREFEGHPVVHMVCSKEALGDEFTFWLFGGRLADGGVEIWISTEYEVQVGNITWWEGEDEDGVYHNWRTEQRVWDINAPFNIEAPEGAQAPGLPDDVPLIPGAHVLTAMSGMASFEVDADLDEVLDFYREQMPEHGWTLQSEFGEMFTYTKNGREATLIFSEVNDKVNGVVMITE